MKGRHGLAAVALLLVCGAVVLVVALVNGRDSPAPVESALRTNNSPSPTQPAVVAPRQAVPTEAWVDVRVQGSPAWIRAGAIDTFSATATSPPPSWESPFATATYAEGSGRVRLQPSTWSWVRVQPAEPSAPTALVRVPPLVGTRELHVVLQDTASLHVLVLQADGRAPAAGAEVVVEQRLPTGGFAAIGNATTDASGHARLTGLSDGEIVVRTAISSVTDPEPLSARRVLQGRCALADQVVTLLLAPARRRLELEVEVAAFPHDLGLPPRLYLRDPHGGRVIPVLAALQSGSNRVEVDIEPGDYLVDCLPIGSFQTNLAGGTLCVPADPQHAAKARVVLGDNRARTRLVLAGLRTIDFPIRVCLRDPSLPVHPDERLMFYGQLSWRGATADVPSVVTPMQIVVSTKQGWLTSRAAIRIAGTELRVELVPACCATIAWKTEDRPVRPVVVVRSEGSALVVPLRLAADGPPAPPVVGFKAEVVLPHGSAVFSCTDESGRALWHREVNLTTAMVEVTP